MPIELRNQISDELHVMVPVFFNTIASYSDQLESNILKKPSEGTKPTYSSIAAEVLAKYSSVTSNSGFIICLSRFFNPDYKIWSFRSSKNSVEYGIEQAIQRLSIKKWTKELNDDETIHIISEFAIYRIAQTDPLTYLLFSTVIEKCVPIRIAEILKDKKMTAHYLNKKSRKP